MCSCASDSLNMSDSAFFATDEERASATAHMHEMKNKIGGLLEKQTKARLVAEGLMSECSEEEKKAEIVPSEPIVNEAEPAMSMEKREEVEQDTLESQEIDDVLGFLLPPGTVPKKCSNFGLMYNKKALDGWVRQPSACCGAASIAGAWNALMDVHRADADALSHTTVLQVYRAMMLDMIEKKQKSFERRLGADIDPLLEAISVGLQSLGRKIGGKKAVGVTKKAVMAIVRRMAREFYVQRERERESEETDGLEKEQDGEAEGDKSGEDDKHADLVLPPIRSDSPGSTSSPADKEDCSLPTSAPVSARNRVGSNGVLPNIDQPWGTRRSAIECIVELMQADGHDFATAAASTKEQEQEQEQEQDASLRGEDGVPVEVDVTALPEKDRLAVGYREGEEEEEDEDEEGEDDDEVLISNVSFGAKNKRKAGKVSSSSVWDWGKDLMALLKNIAGLKKLCAERPSTAAIGNWGILQAVARMSTECAEPSLGKDGVQARLFLGKKKMKTSKIDVPVARTDDASKIASQWDALRAAFSHEEQCLLFHLKNHYALIFAMREWTEMVEDPLEAQGKAAGAAPCTEAPGDSVSRGDTPTEAPGDSVSRGDTSSAEPEPRTSCRLVKKVTRQILTARKGQRPTAWIDFSEVRNQVLGWEGYKIMALSRGPAFSAQEVRRSRQIDPLANQEQLQARLAYTIAL